MNKEEYMTLLAVALNDIPEAEKEEALDYYSHYLDDAGEENVQEVLKSLGSPSKLADSIRRDLKLEDRSTNVVGENVYQNPYANPQPIKKQMSGGMIALIVILCILASPLLIAVASVVLAIIVTIFSIMLSLAAVIIAVICTIVIAGISCVLAAIALAGISPFESLVLVGMTFIGIGIVVFLVMALVWLFGKAIPWMIDGIVNLFKAIVRKIGGR